MLVGGFHSCIKLLIVEDICQQGHNSFCFQVISDIVNNLLNEKHDLGWNVTRPSGDEGDNLMKVMETFAHVLAQSMENHVNDGSIGGKIGFEQAYMALARHEVGK